MVSGGMTCIKYLLFCFNLLFALSGIAILTVGAIVHIAYAHYSNFLSTSYQSVPLVLIVVGVIIFVVAFFGCCGAVKENHCMIVTFSVLLFVILILELTAGIVGYIRRNEVEHMLESNLNTTMYKYYTKKDVQQSWDIAQHELECCGLLGPGDWKKVTNDDTLPHTCCPNAQPTDGSCTMNSDDKYTSSCFEKLKAVFNKYGSIIGGVGIGIAASQLVGVIFACFLARSIRKEYETV